MKFATVFFLILTSTSALADVAEEIVTCSNVGNTIQINNCAANIAGKEAARLRDESMRAEAVLRRVESFFAKEKPAPKLVQPLQETQAAWLKYKEAECQLAIDLAMGGSVAELHYQGCLASVYEERVKRLRALRMEYERLGY
jgi:uncharacterized protein YecT (DUF1311 family)